jgi:hypothetical protein
MTQVMQHLRYHNDLLFHALRRLVLVSEAKVQERVSRNVYLF